MAQPPLCCAPCSLVPLRFRRHIILRTFLAARPRRPGRRALPRPVAPNGPTHIAHHSLHSDALLALKTTTRLVREPVVYQFLEIGYGDLKPWAAALRADNPATVEAALECLHTMVVCFWPISVPRHFCALFFRATC